MSPTLVNTNGRKGRAMVTGTMSLPAIAIAHVYTESQLILDSYTWANLKKEGKLDEFCAPHIAELCLSVGNGKYQWLKDTDRLDRFTDNPMEAVVSLFEFLGNPKEITYWNLEVESKNQ